MTTVELKWPDVVATTEFSATFLQGMLDRVATSHFKYGTIADAAPRIDWVADLEKRLDLYKKTGNTEWLMDVGNYAMFEFIHPKHPNAHFRPTDTDESPGRKWIGETDRSARHNKEF